MSVRWLLLLTVACAALVGVPGSARADDCAEYELDCGDARPATERHCGRLADADAPRRIVTVGLACAGGRRVAKAQWLQSGRFDACAPRRGSCRVLGYRCVWRGGDTVRCRDGARRVRFSYAR